MSEAEASGARSPATHAVLGPIFHSNGSVRLLSTVLLTGDELSVTDPVNRTLRGILMDTTVPVVLPEELASPSAFLDNVRSGPAVTVIGELLWC